MSAKFPGKGLSNTQVSKPSTVVDQSSGSAGAGPEDRARGKRLDPPKGPAQFPGKRLSGTKTRNAPECDA